MRRAVGLVAAVAVVALSGPALGQSGGVVKLPTPRDAIALVPGAEDILTGAGFEERQFPGRVTDRELVRVGLAPDGSLATVHVEHRLTLNGTGDYSFRIPGPVANLAALPESQSQPGLRRGSIIWQGFAPGRRELAVEFDLDPLYELNRLPIRVSVSGTVDGSPADLTRPFEGDVDLTVELENATGIATRISDADVDPATVAETLDAIHADLDAGRRPVVGKRGVPRSIPSLGPIGTRTETIEAAMRLAGNVGVQGTACDGLRVRGARVNNRALFGFDRVLGGGRPLVHRIRIHGTVPRTGDGTCGFGAIEFEASPVAPRASVASPPEGAASWTDAVSAGLAPPGREMLAVAMSAMWRVARLRLFDAYVGTPDARGPARTEYQYSTIRAGASGPPVAAPAPAPSFGPFGMALSAIAGLLLLFAAGLQWAHA